MELYDSNFQTVQGKRAFCIHFSVSLQWNGEINGHGEGERKRQWDEGQAGLLTEVFSQLNSFASKQFYLLLTVFSKIFQYLFNIFL